MNSKIFSSENLFKQLVYVVLIDLKILNLHWFLEEKIVNIRRDFFGSEKVGDQIVLWYELIKISQYVF
jgi:hypothetical protein